MNINLLGVYILITITGVMILTSIIAKITDVSSDKILGLRIIFLKSLVVVLYYNKDTDEYHEERYTIALWPIKKGCAIRFDLYSDGFLVTDPNLRKEVLKYLEKCNF